MNAKPLSPSRLTPATVLVAALLTVAAPAAVAATCSWSGVIGAWEDSASWSCGVIPDGTDEVAISAGTVTLSTLRTVSRVAVTDGATLQVASPGGLTISSELSLHGTLSGTGNVTVTGGESSWTDGTMLGTGTTELQSGATLEVSGGGPKILDQRTMINSGTIVWIDGNFGLQNAASFENTSAGTFDIRTTMQIYRACCAGPLTFVNNGTIVKSAGTGTAKNLLEEFVNHGLIHVLAGSFRPRTFTSDGTLRTGPDGEIVFDSSGDFTLEDGSVLEGPGAISMLNGTMSVTGTVTVRTLLMKSGVLQGSGDLVIPAGGTMDWQGGTMTGEGRTIVEGDGNLNLILLPLKTIDGRILNNSGTIHWTAGDWSAVNGATIRNFASGLISIESDNQLYQHCCAGPITFVNQGTLRKNGTTGTTSISAGPLDSRSGTIEVQTGFLSLGTPLDLNASSVIRFRLAGTVPGLEHGQLLVSGTPELDAATIDAFLGPAYLPASGTTFTVVTGEYTETFQNSTVPLVADLFARVVYPTTSRVDLVIGHAGTIAFASSSHSIDEPDGPVQLQVDRSGGTDGIVSASWTVSAGTAGPADYGLTSGTVTFPDGSASQTISIPVTDDTLDENTESFTVKLGNPAGHVLVGTPSSAAVTIADDDPPPTVSFALASQASATESGLMTVNVVLSTPSALSVEVPLSVSPASTAGSNDYSLSGTTVHIPAGSASGSVKINIDPDGFEEDDETVVLLMGTPVNATQGATTTHTATISDDDGAVKLTDLRLELEGPASAGRGDTIQFEATVSNHGPRTAPETVLALTAEGLMLVAGPAECSGLTCALGAIGPGGVVALTFQMNIPLATELDRVRLSGVVTSSRQDANETDNLAAAFTRIACTTPHPPFAYAVASVETGIAFPLLWLQEGAVHYEVQEALDEEFTATASTQVTGNSLLVRKTAEQMTAWFFRVRAIADCDGSIGEWSSPVEVRIRPLPEPTKMNQSPPPFVAPYGTTELLVQDLLVGPPEEVTAMTSVEYVITTDRPWLTTDLLEGTMPLEGTLLQVTVDPSTLPAGSSAGTINIQFGAVTTASVGARSTTVSIPVSVSLVTPVMPALRDLPPPENTLIIPAVANAHGVNSEWHSDMRLMNASMFEAEYDMTFIPSQHDISTPVTVTRFPVAAGQTVALDDLLNTWFAIGTFDESAFGFLEVRPVLAEASAIAASRTFDTSSLGTLGQFVPAVPFGRFVGASPGQQPVLSLQQLRQGDGYRTNIGIVEAEGRAVDLVVSLFSADGTQLGSVPVSLGPGQHVQLDALLASGGADVLDARAEVAIVGGSGKITAYASVIDGVSGDPMLVAATDATPSPFSVLPGIANLATGANVWKSDVRLYNGGAGDTVAQLEYFPIGSTEPAKIVSVPVSAGRELVLDDILLHTFDIAQSAGALHIETGTESTLTVTARTYNQRPDGSFGQFIPAMTSASAASPGEPPLRVLYAEESAQRRTNLGIIEMTGHPVTVEIQASAADSKVTATVAVELGPNEFRQLGNVLRSLGIESTYNATITISAVGGSGGVGAYASSIDNLTGDPTYIPAQ